MKFGNLEKKTLRIICHLVFIAKYTYENKYCMQITMKISQVYKDGSKLSKICWKIYGNQPQSSLL